MTKPRHYVLVFVNGEFAPWRSTHLPTSLQADGFASGLQSGSEEFGGCLMAYAMPEAEEDLKSQENIYETAKALKWLQEQLSQTS